MQGVGVINNPYHIERITVFSYNSYVIYGECRLAV
jgi:hypothetical protein